MQTVVILILLFLSGSFVKNASTEATEATVFLEQGAGIGVEDTSKAEQFAEEPDPSHLSGGLPNQPRDGSSGVLPVLPNGGFSERGDFSKTIDSISDSRWFGLLSGFASIVALLLALWGSRELSHPHFTNPSFRDEYFFYPLVWVS